MTNKFNVISDTSDIPSLRYPDKEIQQSDDIICSSGCSVFYVQISTDFPKFELDPADETLNDATFETIKKAFGRMESGKFVRLEDLNKELDQRDNDTAL